MKEIEILVTPVFEKSIKRLAKRYPCVKQVFKEALDALRKPGFGDEIPGHQFYYKVRYPNVDAGKGKSGGFRLIYYWEKDSVIVVLVDIFSKSDQSEVDWDKVNRAIKEMENGP